MQAGAAQLRILFNYRCSKTVLTGPNGRGVTTRATPDDDHVVCHLFFSVASEGTSSWNFQRLNAETITEASMDLCG